MGYFVLPLISWVHLLFQRRPGHNVVYANTTQNASIFESLEFLISLSDLETVLRIQFKIL